MQAVFLLPLLAALAAAQSCTYNTPAGPTNSVDGHISQLSMGGITYSPNCPGKIGVDDQTGGFRPVIGSTGTLSATFHTCGGSYQNGGEVWVDWNGSGTFSKSVGSVGTWQGIASNAVHQFQITVPGGTTFGPKRARIMMDEGALPPLDPCLSFSYGSMIDFTLVVSDLAPSAPPSTPPSTPPSPPPSAAPSAPPSSDPVVTHIEPESGPVGGATRVAVRGTNFLSASGQRQALRCAFGARLAPVHADWVFNDTVLCHTPAAPAAGFVPVRVFIETTEAAEADEAVSRRLLSTEAQKNDIFFQYVNV